MKILNTRKRGKIVLVTKGLQVGPTLAFAIMWKNRSLGPTTNEPMWPCALFEKEEDRDEAIRKLKNLVAYLDANA